MSLRSESDLVRHLLRRFGLGASEAEADFYGQGGYEAAVDRLLNYEAIDEGFTLSLADLSERPGQIQPRIAQFYWYLRLLVTRRPFQEKMTLFWHDHFATSAQKVANGPLMSAHIDTLRSYAVSDFRTLLTKVSQDPAMLFWLDNGFNVAGKPNENFARELFELFTLGIGHYTEADIKEAARAFTGWTYTTRRGGRFAGQPGATSKFVFRADLHDDGEKVVLGNRGRLGGEDVIGIAAAHPQTARHLVRKLWEFFVYPKPEPALVERYATQFRESGLDLKKLIRAMMLSPEFRSERAQRAIVKSPVDFTISTLRQLGQGRELVEMVARSDREAKLRSLRPIGAVSRANKAMGMELLFPPDVSGWEWGAAWITSATVVERVKWSQTLLTGRSAQSLPAVRTADDLANLMVSIFDADLPEAKLNQLRQAARESSGGPLSPRNMGPTAIAVARLLFSSPEFQFM